MRYETWRALNWFYDILTSGLGFGAFVAVLGIMLPEQYDVISIIDEEIDSSEITVDQKLKLIKKSRKLKNSRVLRLIVSWILLALLLISGYIKYKGYVNIEDVFGSDYLYIGQTLNQKADGNGELRNRDDSLLYDGQFKANLYEGSGKEYEVLPINNSRAFASFLKYDGTFHKGLYDGYGKMYDNSGFNVSISSESNGVVVDETGINITKDEGVSKYKPRLKYEGNFKNGFIDGEGIYYFNPDEYEGDIWIYRGGFKEGMYNGYGEKYKNNELVESGDYLDNILVKQYKKE